MNSVGTRLSMAAGLLWACASAQALPLDPIDWVDRRTGAEVCCGFNSGQTFNYDSTSDLFTYSAIGQQHYTAPGLGREFILNMEIVLETPFDWSDTHVAALRVDEPRTGVLALPSLGLLVVLRRKPQLLATRQGR